MSAQDRLASTVASLCSEETAGRAPGSAQGRSARDLLVSEFTALGLSPAGDEGYLQHIPAMGGANVLGSVPGDGPGWIVLGAHYDHLGVGSEPYWGADDNASGVAVMLEVAQRLDTSGRSVLVCAYDAEEPDWFMTESMGSQWWVDHPTVPIDAVDLMVCLDVVGHRVGPEGVADEIGESIFVVGAELSPGLAECIDVPPVPGIRPRPVADWVVPPLSDHYAFRQRGIPHVFYTCARNANYHTPEDVPEALDYDKMAALAQHLTSVLKTARRAPAGTWAFDPSGQDDAATLDTFLAIAEGLPPIGLVSQAVEMLEDLRRGLSGPLPDAERQRLQGLLLAVEALLA